MIILIQHGGKCAANGWTFGIALRRFGKRVAVESGEPSVNAPDGQILVAQQLYIELPEGDAEVRLLQVFLAQTREVGELLRDGILIRGAELVPLKKRGGVIAFGVLAGFFNEGFEIGRAIL